MLSFISRQLEISFFKIEGKRNFQRGFSTTTNSKQLIILKNVYKIDVRPLRRQGEAIDKKDAHVLAVSNYSKTLSKLALLTRVYNDSSPAHSTNRRWLIWILRARKGKKQFTESLFAPPDALLSVIKLSSIMSTPLQRESERRRRSRARKERATKIKPEEEFAKLTF